MATQPPPPVLEKPAEAQTAALYLLLDQLPASQLAQVRTFVEFLLYQHKQSSSMMAKPVARTPGLGRGTIWVSEDFDEPLPDEFWFSPTDPLEQETDTPEVVS